MSIKSAIIHQFNNNKNLVVKTESICVTPVVITREKVLQTKRQTLLPIHSKRQIPGRIQNEEKNTCLQE